MAFFGVCHGVCVLGGLLYDVNRNIYTSTSSLTLPGPVLESWKAQGRKEEEKEKEKPRE